MMAKKANGARTGIYDETSLNPELKAALDDALEASRKGQVSSHEEVRQKTREKYSRRLS